MIPEPRTVDLGEMPVARGTWQRMRGLLGRDERTVGPGMIFPRCRSVHTMGMRIPIDIVFLDVDNRVLAVHPRVAPCSLTAGTRAVRGILELPPGRAERLRLEPGCVVTWRAT